MDKIEIEVPENQIAEVNKQPDGNILIKFKDKEFWKSIKTVVDAITYLQDNDMCSELLSEFDMAPRGSYSEKLAEYRIVVAALTNNEERKLKTGDCWFPVVQFCEIGKEKNCWGNKKMGTIKHDEKKYAVVGGCVNSGMDAGIGDFSSLYDRSNYWAHVGFRSVSSKEIAQYISEKFGRLLFEVQYGGVNCDWEWID